MLRHAYECLKSNPCDTNKGCKEINGICVYNKKKCFYDNEEKKCKQRCDIFNKSDTCDKNYCKWNSNEFKMHNEKLKYIFFI